MKYIILIIITIEIILLIIVGLVRVVNRNINKNDGENNIIVINNIENRSVSENCVNLSIFLNNESVN